MLLTHGCKNQCFRYFLGCSKSDNYGQVGTILNAEDAQNAIVAGAKFLMSPAMVKVSTMVLEAYFNILTV